jgi:phage terminase small subunit
MSVPKRFLNSTLNDQQEAYCRHFVEHGGSTRRAMELAGYDDDGSSKARVQLHRLRHNPAIRDRIHQITREAFTSDAVEARECLLQLIRTARSEKVRLDAARDLLDRAGHKPLETLLTMNASAALDETELKEKISGLLSQLNIDPASLKRQKEVMDAAKEDFEEATFSVTD